MTERPQTTPHPTDPRATQPRAAEPRAAEPRAAEPRAAEPRAAGQRAGSGSRAGDPRGAADGSSTALLSARDLDTVTRRWHEIQAGFVDEPQQAVKDADALVADLMERLAQVFAAERHQLESHWSRGDQVSTEDLRVALQRYRSFFQRLLAVH